MNLELIYPAWPKLPHQPEFHLPPHGPVCFAATVPDDVDLRFTDEHVQSLTFRDDADLVAMSCMLSCQMPRAWEIADQYRQMGKTVIFGGIGTMLHADETQQHADSVFLGEAEGGHFARVLADFRHGRLQARYDFMGDLPDVAAVPPARRAILDRTRYNFRGVQMVDLLHASRGCRFNCFPCCTAFLGGRQFRPRPVDQVAAELAAIDNQRIFFVDNSFAQDLEWNKRLFREIAPLHRTWVSHPIQDDPELLDLAVEAGCWYVYQAVFDTSDYIRRRIRHYKERGIGVEATVILGMDDHDEDYIKRLVDFLLEVDVDLAEFTVLTPFPHTPIRGQLEADGRILHSDWGRYTGGEVVFQPALVTPAQLQDMYDYAWETFYAAAGLEVMMGRLYMKAIQREVTDGTYRRTRLTPRRGWVHPEGRQSP